MAEGIVLPGNTARKNLLSRSIAGVKGRTLLFTLPGSPKAVAEYMEEIHKILYHAVLMVQGIGAH